MPVGRAAEIISVSSLDTRRMPRRAVAFSVFVRDSGSSAVQGRVTDLSLDGCRVEGAGAFDLHSQFWLKLSGHAPIRAQVLWSDAEAMGCSFIPPLDQGTFENLVRAEPGANRKIFSLPFQGR
jgi:hypothetical protein